jgi:hypothetical protein
MEGVGMFSPYKINKKYWERDDRKVSKIALFLLKGKETKG